MPIEIVMNHATFRNAWGFDAFVEACATAGMERVSVWGNEMAQVGLPAARSKLRDTGLGVFGYNRAGPFLASTPVARAALIAGAKTEIETAAEIGADHVLLFPGPLKHETKGLTQQRNQTADTAAILLEHARSCGITLALEPLHPMLAGDRTALCTLRQANQLCDDLGTGVGIVVDSYHVWWDNDLEEQLLQAGAAGRFLGLHVNDWLIPTTHMLTDRGMMGDGIIDLAGLWASAQRAGYHGPIEVEIFSEHWWSQDPNVVLRTALDRCAEIFAPERTG